MVLYFELLNPTEYFLFYIIHSHLKKFCEFPFRRFLIFFFSLGTSVSASKLFGKLPVRRQYYNNVKKKKDELKRIEDLVIAFGIIQPGVRLTLRNDKDLIWQKNPMSDVEKAFSYVFGRHFLSQMVAEEFTVDPKVTLFMTFC